MPDPSLPLQAAIVARLKTYAPLTALVGSRIYDAAPGDAVTPYVTFGEDQIIGDRADGYDGSEFFLTLHAWATEPGYPQVKRISAAIRDALHEADLAVEGFRLVDIEFTDTRHMRDPDGLTSHAVTTLHGFAEPID